MRLFTVNILIIFLFFLKIGFSQTGWVSQSSGTTANLNSVYFISDMTGWTVGDTGKILKTTNGGTNWLSQASATSHTLLSVFFINSLTGWATGGEGDIITTGNGGTNWMLQSTGSTSALNSIYFISSFTGWAVGEFMTILKTTNSGVNWTALFSGEVALHSVMFTSASVGYIAGNGGYVMKSTNGGINWTVQNSDVSYNLYSICFPPTVSTTGYTVGMGTPSPPILKSTDSGNNWAIQSVPLGNALNSVYFVNVSTGWAAGFLGTIKQTSNGGINWSDQTSGTTNTLRSVFFVNSTTGWVAGDFGTIRKTGNGGFSGITKIGTNVPEKFYLHQNYPNPFNPETLIEFDIAKESNLILKIFDINGKEITTLYKGRLSSGKYRVKFNAVQTGIVNLPSGIYFYRLTADNYNETRKLVFIK